MKRAVQIFSVLSIIAVLSLFIGCSSSTSSDSKTVGDFDDLDYQDVMGITENSNITTGMMFDYLGTMVEMVVTDPANTNQHTDLKFRTSTMAAVDTFLITYHESSGYWYLYVYFEDTTYLDGGEFELLTMTIEDSIKFFHGSEGVQWPDSALLTRVQNGAMFEAGSTFHGSMSSFWNVNVEGADIFTVGDVVINGSNGADISLTDESGNCTAVASLEGVISNVATNILFEEDCPSSGYIRQSGNFNIACTGDTTYTHIDNWIIQETFLGDSIAVVVENSTDRWEYTASCGPIQTVSPMETMADLLR